MRKLAAPLLLLITLGFYAGSPGFAAHSAKPAAPAKPSASTMHLEQAKPEPLKGSPQDSSSVQNLLRELQEASNRHDIDGILKHYAPNFTSGDSLGVKEVRGLILDTWKMFPDIHYESQTLETRLNGNWATVESIDTATASAKLDPSVSTKAGTMNSRSRGMLYLHRIGKSWEIVSDATLYEKATITYGPYENIDIDVETPEQVFSGEAYTAKVLVSVPVGNIAFATLSQEPLTYPQHSEKDKFRTLSSDKTDLERIFKANSTNNNEVVTATIGFTEIGQDDQDRPTINLKGVMTIVKRVNVTPRSTFKEVSPESTIIHSTADGKIKLNPESSDSPSADDEPGMPSSSGPDSPPADDDDE